MDVKQIASRLGLEEDDVYDVLDLLIETAPHDIMKLSAACKNRDTVRAGEAAHSLKGSTSTLGFMDISNHAQLIMKQSRDNKIEELIHTVPSFLNQMEELLMELKELLKNR